MRKNEGYGENFWCEFIRDHATSAFPDGSSLNMRKLSGLLTGVPLLLILCATSGHTEYSPAEHTRLCTREEYRIHIISLS
eukprot:4886648-Pyramimonas_sp.AAC.1